MEVSSNTTNSSKEADEVDRRVGEDGQVLSQLGEG